jgi:hypothetical protein
LTLISAACCPFLTRSTPSVCQHHRHKLKLINTRFAPHHVIISVGLGHYRGRRWHQVNRRDHWATGSYRIVLPRLEMHFLTSERHQEVVEARMKAPGGKFAFRAGMRCLASLVSPPKASKPVQGCESVCLT